MRGCIFDFPDVYKHIKVGQQMRDCGREKVEGWQEWLCRYNLWDEVIGEEGLYLRYMKFHKVKFSEVSEDKWHIYFRDLLQFEPALVFGDAIGYCPEFPFAFEVLDDSPLVMKPMPYPRLQRDWIREYIQG